METSANLNQWSRVLLFILYTADMWNDLENKIISYSDDTTLYAEVIANSLNRD